MYQRDLRRSYELKDEPLTSLIEELQVLTGRDFDEAFADNINNFIGILREKYLINLSIKTNKEMDRELKRVRTAANKLYNLIDSEIHDEAEMILLQTVPEGFDECHNHSYHAAEHAKKLAQVCDEALSDLRKKRIRSKKAGFSFVETREFIAIELARELSKFGVEITAYRDGVFLKCLKAFLKAFNGTPTDKIYNIPIPDDLFDIAQICKEKHMDSERFVLLQFE